MLFSFKNFLFLLSFSSRVTSVSGRSIDPVDRYGRTGIELIVSAESAHIMGNPGSIIIEIGRCVLRGEGVIEIGDLIKFPLRQGIHIGVMRTIHIHHRIQGRFFQPSVCREIFLSCTGPELRRNSHAKEEQQNDEESRANIMSNRKQS